MGKYLLKKLFYDKRLLTLCIAFSLLSIFFFNSTSYAQNRMMLADDPTPTETTPATTTPFVITPIVPSITPPITPPITPTVTPTITPTPVPTPTPTSGPPILPPPTPMPTMANTPTSTPTPTPTPTLTPTTLPVGHTSTPNDPTSGQGTPKPGGNPNENSTPNGFARIAPMIGISLLLALVVGSLFFLFYQRSHKQQLIPQFNKAKLALAPNTQWGRDSNATLAQSPSTTTAATPLIPADTTTFHEAPTIQHPTHFIPSTDTQEPNYTPRNQQSMPMPLSPQTHSDVTYVQTSDMNALPLDTLNVPDHNENVPSPTCDHSIPISSSPIQPTIHTVQPPDVTQDATLYNVMQQAQLGIFIIPKYEPNSIQGA